MCLPRGTVPAPSQTLKDPRLTGAPPLWYLLRALRRGRAPQDSTEGSVSDACGLLRLCRRSGTPRGIPAAAGRPQGSDFFRAWRAFGEQERRQNRQIFGSRARPNCMSIDYNLVQACDPALAFLTVKNTEKVYSNRLFALPECLPRVSPSAVKLHIM